MSEEEKIKHIFKGIAEDAFQMLLAKNPQTVADVINLCQSYDELRKQRALTRRSFAQDESLSSLTAGHGNSTLSPLLQQFIREEDARPLSLVPYAPMPDSNIARTLRRAMQQQVADALPCSRQPAPVDASVTGADTAQPTTAAVPFTYVTSTPAMPVAGPLTYAETVARPFVEAEARPPIIQAMPGH